MEHLGDPNDYENLTSFRENFSLSNGYTIGSESCEILEQLEHIDFNAIRKIFLEAETANVDKIEFNDIRYDDITDYMANERSFSRDRVNASLNRLKKSLEKKSQTLEKWF